MIPIHCAPPECPDQWRLTGICPDCAERLRARVAELEAERDRLYRENTNTSALFAENTECMIIFKTALEEILLAPCHPDYQDTKIIARKALNDGFQLFLKKTGEQYSETFTNLAKSGE